MTAPGQHGIAILAELGFLAPEEPGLQAEDLSRSHLVTRVSTPQGASFVVKTASPSASAVGRGLAAELAVYRLATWLDELAAVVPEPLLIDEGRQLLVLRADAAGPSLAAAPDRASWTWIGEVLGAAMARWHKATEGMLLGARTRPFVLDLAERPEEAVATLGPAAQALARELLGDPVAGDAVRRVAADWTPECLVHGDLTWENCLFADGLRIADWELAAYGDPAWDLGTAIGELRCAGVRYARDPGPAVDALLDAYAGHRALAKDARARVERAATARVVQAAIELGEVARPDVAAALAAAATGRVLT